MSEPNQFNPYALSDAIARRFKGESSAADEILIVSWLKTSTSNQKVYEELLAEYQKSNTSVNEAHSYAALALQRVYDKHTKISHRRRNRIRIGVSIALAAAMLTGILFYVSWKNLKMPTLDIVQAAGLIPPAGERAILILPGGKQLDLHPRADSSFTSGGTQVHLRGDSMVYYALGKNVATELQQLYTPNGATYKMVLSDGTKVWLNVASSLKFPSQFIGKERTVEVQGEVYFDIAADPAHPFIVRTQSGMKIQALGTAFNVRSYPETGIQTTLISGSVKVSAGGMARILKPGEQATVDTGQSMAGLKISKADLQAVTGWKSHLFVFNGTMVSELLKEIERWYDVKVIYQQGFTGNKKYHGELSRDMPLGDLVETLEGTGVAHFTITGRMLYVTSIAQ